MIAQSEAMKERRRLWWEYHQILNDPSVSAWEKIDIAQWVEEERSEYIKARHFWSLQRTAAALAEAQAEVARLRAALKAIISVVVPAERFERKIYDASLEIDVYTDVLRIARAALKTAPAGGA